MYIVIFVIVVFIVNKIFILIVVNKIFNKEDGISVEGNDGIKGLMDDGVVVLKIDFKLFKCFKEKAEKWRFI